MLEDMKLSPANENAAASEVVLAGLEDSSVGVAPETSVEEPFRDVWRL